jgi:DNA-binding SARP family transcriptional activator
VIAETNPPVRICLLGSFRVLSRGSPVMIRPGSKTEALLSSLALHERCSASRDWLLESLWPDSDLGHASSALNSLIHAIRKLLNTALGGQPPIIGLAGGYQLNVGAGVAVDVLDFDELVRQADRRRSAGDVEGAMQYSLQAVALYRGDICTVDGLRALVERERLRASHLSLLGRIADYYFDAGNYASALEYALRLLTHDPCREDGHRLVMRCHVRLGERAQAFRQYRTCRQMLATEFGAQPEKLTEDLFEQVRTLPGSV